MNPLHDAERLAARLNLALTRMHLEREIDRRRGRMAPTEERRVRKSIALHGLEDVDRLIGQLRDMPGIGKAHENLYHLERRVRAARAKIEAA
jgi:hypothetical protein